MSELHISAQDTATGESYGTLDLARGRLTIPKPLRGAVYVEAGTVFTVIRAGGDIRLVRQVPELHSLVASRGEKRRFATPGGDRRSL